MVASAAVACLGGVPAACAADGPDGGHTAVGAGRAGPTAVAPSEPVTLVPLDGAARRGTGPRRTGPTARQDGPDGSRSTAPARPAGEDTSATPGPTPSPTAQGTPAGPGRRSGPPEPDGGRGGRTTPSATPSAPEPGRTAPAAPADLSWGDPRTADTDRRRCQEVTVAFRNSGGTAVRSGEVTFGTHVIGALGVDWATVESTARLPVPPAPGARSSPTWTVCVEAWRVPLGMHIETRDVSVAWK